MLQPTAMSSRTREPRRSTTSTVTDNRIPTVSCPVTTLAAAPGPGNRTTSTGSYTITQADIDDALVTTIAEASARTRQRQVVIDTDDAVINRAFPAITADKQPPAPITHRRVGYL